MGLHIFVSEQTETGELKIQAWDGRQGDTTFPDLEPGWALRYHEYNSVAFIGSLRVEWMRTSAGKRALRIALDADARGECRCDVLGWGGIPGGISLSEVN